MVKILIAVAVLFIPFAVLWRDSRNTRRAYVAASFLTLQEGDRKKERKDRRKKGMK
jgi:hypothetical protein